MKKQITIHAITILSFICIFTKISIAETLNANTIKSYTDEAGYFKYTITDGEHGYFIFSIYYPELIYDITYPDNWSYTIEYNGFTWNYIFTANDASSYAKPGDIFEIYSTSNKWGIGLVWFYDIDGNFGPIVMLAPYPEPSVLTVNIDIKPDSLSNQVNVNSKGKISVAILGTEDFDVFKIDPASIRLAGVAPLRSSYKDITSPSSEGPDDYLDLTLKFDTQDILETLIEEFEEVNDGDEFELTLTGILDDDTPIEGKDCIVIISKEKPDKKGG